MCGRVTITKPDLKVIAELLDAEAAEEDASLFRPRYNGAPTDPLWIVRQSSGRRRIVPARWGIWTPSKSMPLIINSRVETVAKQPRFREAYQSRRCLVAVDGFYEWKGPPKARRPIWYHAPSGLL